MGMTLAPDLQQLLPGLLVLAVLVAVGHSLVGSWLIRLGVRRVWLATAGILVLAVLGGTLLFVRELPGWTWPSWLAFLVPFFAIPLAAASAVIHRLSRRSSPLPRMWLAAAAVGGYLAGLPFGIATAWVLEVVDRLA